MSEVEYEVTYEGGIVYLFEVLTDKMKIENVEFRGCELRGPAVVFLGPDCLHAGGFNLRVPKEVGMESVIWPAHTALMVGLIGLENCKFVNCWWDGIGFVVADEEDRALLWEKATLARHELDL